ncbi:MAG: S9 family peptidase [Rhodoferax sp.]|nr:S9 family peptidase [Rhodoferax sp.]
MLRFIVIANAIAVLSWSSACLAATPPVAEIKTVTETMQGVVVKDPYRYLEDVKSPPVLSWYKAQSDYAREQLDRIAVRDSLEKRLAELTTGSSDAISRVQRTVNGSVFYLKRPKGERQYKLAVRNGFKGVERLLADPEVQAKATGVPHAINYFVPSWDGKYVAYGMSGGGSEDASLYIVEVSSGRTVGEPIVRVSEDLVHWLPDSKSLTYNQLKAPTPGEPETEKYLDSSVYVLKVGDAPAKAKAVFGPTVTKGLGLQRLDVAAIHFAPGSPWMVARTTDTTLPEGFLFVAPLSKLGHVNAGWKKVSAFSDKIVDIALKGQNLYYLTHKDAPRRKVMRLDLRRPQLKNAVEIAVAPKDGVIEDFTVTRDALIASVRQGAEIVLRRYPEGQTNSAGQAIAMPFNGAARVVPDGAHAFGDVLFTSSGWTQLPRIYLLQGDVATDTGLQVNPLLPNLPDVEVVNVEVPSHDGALVPMTLLYKKGLKRDGNNPTLLSAYGAYGITQTAGFSAGSMVWIEQGGVMAIANVRGSSVHGDPWYRAGQKATKPNTWKDGIACAQYLIAQKYASPQTLAVQGGSAGGIFAGRAATSAPQLFAAAILNVGSLDTLRAEESANGITNISEFGSVKNPAEFPALLEMSTYHQITDGTAYPAVMLVHGMNDPRVEVWHSGKTAARLQAASSSGKSVLLRLDMQAGHGMGSTATQRNSMAADIYAFLLWQMGKSPLKQ